MPNRRMRSVEPSRFSMVPRNDVPRSAFDLSHTHKTTFDAGELIPVLVHEVLPGDSMRVNMTALCRLATPLVPIMDNLHLESFFFFCPNRLVWDNWQRFMGEQLNPSDTTGFLVPIVPIPNTAPLAGTGYLYDYFGILHAQPGVGAAMNVNALPFRMYNLIWNEFFRDEDLDTPVPVPTGDGPDDLVADDYAPHSRRKRHDYFTSCRPWPEKPSNAIAPWGNLGAGGVGGPYAPGQVFGNVGLGPVGAPVTGLGVWTGTDVPLAGPLTTRQAGGRDVTVDPYYTTNAGSHAFVMDAQPAGNYPDVRVLINDIRTANMLQILGERNARGGTRYTEILRSHFGVISPDARLQRPEYLGGGHSMVQINPIAQTAPTGIAGTSTVLGELAAVGTAVADRHGFSQSFTEHGFVIGLVNVRADLSYQQGIERMWLRRGRYDFYWPALAHMGEQAVYSAEIYAAGDSGDTTVFGYQERWAEYRNKPNRISAGFRSTNPQSLDVWHLSQEFTARPVLNTAFITENPPIDRVLQTDTLEGFEFLFDSVFDIRMVRPLPMFSIPGMGPRL